MSFALRSRRALAILIALALAIAVLTLSPLASSIASASTSSNTSNAAKGFAAINQYRSQNSKPALIENGFVDRWAQEDARLTAADGKHSTHQNPDTGQFGLFQLDGAYVLPAHIKGGSESKRAAKALALMEASNFDSPLLLGTSTVEGAKNWNYAGVGFATHGSSSYVVVLLAYYSPSAPNHTPPGLITATKPVITGTARFGTQLTASTTVTPTPTSLTYAWHAGSNAVGTNSPTYTPSRNDIGSKITVTITAFKSGYQTYSGSTSDVENSLQTKAVASALITTSAKPTVSGSRRVGQYLTLTSSTWGPGVVAHTWQLSLIHI